jgi:hypothetical protein
MDYLFVNLEELGGVLLFEVVSYGLPADMQVVGASFYIVVVTCGAKKYSGDVLFSFGVFYLEKPVGPVFKV